VSSQKPRERTVTRSFRIKQSALSALQEESEKRNISVNTMLNLLLISFAEYDRFLEEFSMVKLSRPTFRKVLQASSEQAIREAGKRAGSTLPKSFLLAKRGEISREGLIDYLLLMSKYANLFEFNMTTNGRGVTVTLVHDLGTRGSEFFGEYIKSALKEAGLSDDVEFDENSVTLALKENTPD
jgi:hypothetical protein